SSACARWRAGTGRDSRRPRAWWRKPPPVSASAHEQGDARDRSDTMLLSEEQAMVREMARGFARDVLAPNAAQWARDHAFPAQALRQMGELGLLGMLVPHEWDGAGVDHVAYALALEEIAAGDGAVSTIMSVH